MMFRTQATHSWPLIVHYHRCPKCGFVLESRTDYELFLGEYRKHLVCDRCEHDFIATKKYPATFGPLLGDPRTRDLSGEGDY